jgi:H+/Cl- antiporter ClcA
MTPSVAIGALLATMTGGIWIWVWPGSPSGALAVVGGTALLASSMKIPLTAIALMMEFTRVGHDFFIPMAFAVAGSVAASHLSSVRALSAWTPRDRTVPVLDAAGDLQA